jgi:FHA domain-containing protein
MLLRGTVRSAVSGVRGGLSPSDNGVASTDRFSRLDAGTVRAGGLSYYSDGSATAGAAAGRRSGRRPAGAAVPVDQMTPSDISGAQTSAMEVPKARGRGAGTSAAKAAAAAAAAQEAAALQAAAQEAAGQEAAAQQAAAQQAAAAVAKDAGGDAEPAAGQADGGGAGAEAGAAVGLAKPANSPGSTPPQATFAPTEAWVTPESSAQERQATELWSGPVSPPDQAGAAQDAPLAGPQQGSAADLQGMEPDVTAPPEPVSGFDPAQGEPFEAVLLLDAGSGSGVDAPAREPLSKVKDMPPGTSSYVSAGPIIQGVYCKNGHFDDPEALFCAICGISMNQQTLVPRPGERPPLGVLLLDDGAVFQLDSDYVIGREPGLDASVAQGKARPLRITDESGIVSRVHARIHLDGWRVLVTDLGSANGTRVLLPAQPADQPLVPQVPIVLATGSQVDLGGRGFRYESHRGR